MGSVQNVRLQFQLDDSETIPAINQHIYIDVTPGSMTPLRSNTQGIIVAAGGQAVTLDDSRDYRIVTSANAITPVTAQAATVRVRNQTINVPPHIRIRITNNVGLAQSGMHCILTVGSQSSNLTTSARGWIWSNDRSAGAVTLNHRPAQRGETKLLKTSGAANPQTSLTVTPSQLPRGTQATISITAPAGAVGLRLVEWKYAISHENPGLGRASATVTRPDNENPNTFDDRWAGEICASGTLTAKFAVGVRVRATGAAAVSATVIAAEPAQATVGVTVAGRTGPSWESTLTENAEQALNRAINSYADMGEHEWNSASANLSTSPTINSGPNKGCQYVSSVQSSFTSTPRINPALSNSADTFSQAQGKAYLWEPAPVRVIPTNLYTVVGPEGAIRITNESAFRAWAGAAPQYRFSSECISAAALLAGTRRHEFNHPAGRSHKENCLKARRALDPAKFAEQLVKVPGGQLNFQQKFGERRQRVIDAAATHNIVDEPQTRNNHELRFVSGQTIPDVNADANGSRIAPAWNPSTNNYL